jgi:hypothetical protein
MSARRKRPRRDATTQGTRDAPVHDSEADATDRRARPPGLFGGALFASGPSALPPLGRSLGRGFIAVASQPVLVLAAVGLVAATWLGLLSLGFEGSPGRLVDVLAMPPISTYFDLGTGASLYGVGPAFLAFTGVALLVRAIVVSVLTGMILESLEQGRVSGGGVMRGLRAIPTTIVVSVFSFSLIVAGNLVFPVLGPGIGFLGFVSALVAGLFFLGFAPAAAIREGRTVTESIRRSGRAAMLPGGRHLLLCTLYFFLALPVVVGFAPSGTEITANPSLGAWVFVLLANVAHLAFMAAFAYRWVVAEPEVPEEPVRRRQPARPPSGRSRGPC